MRFTAYTTSYLIFVINFHNNFTRLLHETVFAPRALIVVSPAAVLAEKLAALLVLALERLIYDFVTDTAQKVFVQLVNWWVAQSQHIETLLELNLFLH